MARLLSRRAWAAHLGALGAAWLSGVTEQARAAGTPGDRSAVPPVVADSAEIRAFLERHPLPARYRSAQPYLLQPVPRAHVAPRVAGGAPLRWDQFGPTHRYVDAHTGWAWRVPGGDWTDADGTAQGDKPWFSVQTVPLGPGPQPADYTAEVTRLVNRVVERKHWLALMMLAPGAPRTISGLRHPLHQAPAIDVTYVDGEFERLRCRIVAALAPSSQQPVTALPETALPAVLEFDRPRRAVRSAKLRFTVVTHWSGRSPLVEGYLLDPPVAPPPVQQGLAASAGRLDDRLAERPGIIGVHRYADGSVLSDFVAGERVNFHAVRLFDPAIYGLGPHDSSRLPHSGLGKWHNAGPPLVLVPSSYDGEGFQPLAPGLGALRLHMPAARITDGAVTGQDGTLGGHAMIFLPEPLYGRLDRLFVRYYVRLGLPGDAMPRHRLNVFRAPGQPDWIAMSGKFGIGPDHSTSLGGVSGSSGGGGGWQMRLSWYECDAGVGGPDERGLAPGFHLYDFQGANPPGHRYGTEWGPQDERWGQRTGHGGMLYAGHWYCVETDLKLNSVSSRAPGYRADGELRAWVDGRLVWERTGMVFRTLPLAVGSGDPARLPPCRELGVRGLWLNWFHGGRTPNTVPRTVFYTGLAWGTEYIGPMAL